REHDRDAGEEDEQREDQIVEAQAFPRRVRELLGEEAADRAHDRPLVARHLADRQHGAVAAQDPDEAEAAQRIDRFDALGLQGGLHIDITHGTSAADAWAIGRPAPPDSYIALE